MTEKTALLLNELTPAQKNYVTNRLAAKEKDLSVAYLCWFFCIHYFYLRKPVRNISNVSADEKPPSDGQREYLRQFFNHFIPSGFLEAVKQDSCARGADALVK